jgi:hypothetical protein
MKYEVGQIIYILKNKNLQIIPARVKEEIVRKTIDETIVQYVLGLPDNNQIMIEDVNDKIFKDVNTLKDFMIENTKKTVEALIEKALEDKEKYFNKTKEPVETNQHVQNDIKQVIMNSEVNKEQITSGEQ